MKYVIILTEGAADEPVPELDGRTPLKATRIPNMDWISRRDIGGADDVLSRRARPT